MNRVYNFSAGPATLPVEVLKTAQEELIDYHGTGTSIMEVSHRGKLYTSVHESAKQRLKNLLGLNDEFHVLFLQGGASQQFMQVPYNFLAGGETAEYISTGAWSKKAIKEAKLFGKVHVPYDGEINHFTHIPDDHELQFTDKPVYVHFTSNNTIFGTQFRKEPETQDVLLVCDASSDILSRRMDVDKYGLIYAGAQKNLGPAGVTIVLLRDEFLRKTARENIPTILKYSTHTDKLFHTPPTFAVYLVDLVLKWIEDKGGIDYFQQLNEKKAWHLYNTIDSDDFYYGTAEKNSRSFMNVTFRLRDESIEQKFIDKAEENGMVALKGHRSVGGIRASIYNAMPMEGVKALTDFMEHFKAKFG